jgi:hypothetical protein
MLMAARVDPIHACPQHQALHHFVPQAEWSDEELLRRVAQWVVPKMDWSGGGVTVSISLGNDQVSLPVAWRLYLPKAWAEDALRPGAGRGSQAHEHLLGAGGPPAKPLVPGVQRITVRPSATVLHAALAAKGDWPIPACAGSTSRSRSRVSPYRPNWRRPCPTF